VKRLFFGFLCLLYAVGAISQTPGSVVVRGEYITTTGCLSFLNDAQSLKKTGLCSFTIIAPGVKLKDFACNSTSVTDTIINCTYTPIKKLSATYNASPNEKAGTILLSIGDIETSNGCFSQLNLPVLQCGFNIVLIGVSIPNAVLSSKVSGGDTWLEASYAPVKP
jgi:hypothetical protein